MIPLLRTIGSKIVEFVAILTLMSILALPMLFMGFTAIVIPIKLFAIIWSCLLIGCFFVWVIKQTKE